MNISQYWQLPVQEKRAIFEQVIKPIEHCEECHAECSDNGFTCYWCEAVICPKHVKTEQFQGWDIKVCNGCYNNWGG